jgi:hypothetical protein
MKFLQIDIFKDHKAKDYKLIDNLAKGKYFKDESNIQDEELIKFLKDFAGVEENDILDMDLKNVIELYKSIATQISSKKHEEPPKEITINKTTYVFVTDYLKMPYGWHQHIKIVCDEESDPLDKLGLLYIEKGMRYAEKDHYGNVINPSDERTKLLSEHLTLGQFYDVNGFFLSILELHLKLSIQEKNLLRMRGMRKRALTRLTKRILMR